MPDLFGMNIAKIINDEIASAGGVLDATLIVVTPGTRTSGNLTGGTNPTTESKSCKGFKDTLKKLRPHDVVEDASDLVVLLGDSIEDKAVPVAGDQVTIEGATKKILKVARDPAGATYECQVD